MFANKVVLITGSGSGIGAATAVHFAKLGASVVITGRNIENLNKIAKKCEEVGKVKPLVLQGDLTDEEFTKDLVVSTIKHFKRLDVLVNNAATAELGSIENTSLQQFDKIFNVNVRAVYHLSMLAVPYLIETKGNIVNVSSIKALRSFNNFLAYCMSKAAIQQLTYCTALDLASKQVRVNSVNPGVIMTNLYKKTAGATDEEAAKFFEQCKETHPIGRAGQPEEIAECIAFLASDRSAFITGANLTADGGAQLQCIWM